MPSQTTRAKTPPTRYRRLFVFISFIPLYGASFAFSAISLAERFFAPAYLGTSEGIAEVGDPATFPVLNTINLACTATMILLGIVGLVTFGRKSRLPAILCTSAAELTLKNDQALTFYISFVIPLLALALRLSWSAFAAYCVAVGFLMVLLGRTGTCYCNPIVVALGYNIYDAALTLSDAAETDERVTILSRERLTRADRLELVQLDDGYYFARPL